MPALRVLLAGGEGELVLADRAAVGQQQPGAVGEAGPGFPGHGAGQQVDVVAGRQLAQEVERGRRLLRHPGDLLVRGETRGLEMSEEHTSEHQPLMRISYAVFCLLTETS